MVITTVNTIFSAVVAYGSYVASSAFTSDIFFSFINSSDTTLSLAAKISVIAIASITSAAACYVLFMGSTAVISVGLRFFSNIPTHFISNNYSAIGFMAIAAVVKSISLYNQIEK